MGTPQPAEVWVGVRVEGVFCGFTGGGGAGAARECPRGEKGTLVALLGNCCASLLVGFFERPWEA